MAQDDLSRLRIGCRAQRLSGCVVGERRPPVELLEIRQYGVDMTVIPHREQDCLRPEYWIGVVHELPRCVWRDCTCQSKHLPAEDIALLVRKRFELGDRTRKVRLSR